MFNNENLTINKRFSMHFFNCINCRLMLSIVHKSILFFPLNMFYFSKFRKFFLNYFFRSFSINLSNKNLSKCFRIIVPSIYSLTILIIIISFSFNVIFMIISVILIIIRIYTIRYLILLIIIMIRIAVDFSSSLIVIFIVFFCILIFIV